MWGFSFINCGLNFWLWIHVSVRELSFDRLYYCIKFSFRPKSFLVFMVCVFRVFGAGWLVLLCCTVECVCLCCTV